MAAYNEDEMKQNYYLDIFTKGDIGLIQLIKDNYMKIDPDYFNHNNRYIVNCICTICRRFCTTHFRSKLSLMQHINGKTHKGNLKRFQ